MCLPVSIVINSVCITAATNVTAGVFYKKLPRCQAVYCICFSLCLVKLMSSVCIADPIGQSSIRSGLCDQRHASP